MHKAISFVHVFKIIFENHYIINNIESCMNGFPARAPVIPACSQQESRKLRLACISHQRRLKIVIRLIIQGTASEW